MLLIGPDSSYPSDFFGQVSLSVGKLALVAHLELKHGPFSFLVRQDDEVLSILEHQKRYSLSQCSQKIYLFFTLPLLYFLNLG